MAASWTTLIAVVAVLLLPACGLVHERAVDAAAMSECAAPTPVADFDEFVRGVTAGRVAHDDLLGTGLPARVYELGFAYDRSRFAAGQRRLDPVSAAECVRAMAAFGLTTGACSLAQRPRCPAPEGSPCGNDNDCDLGLACELPSDASECERRGRCRVGAPVGAPCAADNAPCVNVFEEDFVGCYSAVCVRFQPVSVGAGSACTPGEVSPESAIVVVPVCTPESVCTLHGCELRHEPVQLGEVCGLGRRCATGLFCRLSDHTCRLPSDIECGDADLSCPDSAAGSLACVGVRCQVTDGSRGSPCDPGVGYPDCEIGLSCSADGHCDDPLGSGAECNVTNQGERCASQCCASGRCL